MNEKAKVPNVTVNPLRLSQPSGASLAFMGIKGCIPLWHGVQGCTAFAKILFIQHFREPMPFQTTALTQTSVVMGGDANVFEAVDNLQKEAKLFGLLSTGVAETSGADIQGTVRLLRQKAPDAKIVAVNTPDYTGTLENGWGKACAAVLKQFVKPRTAPRKRQAAVLVGPYTTPGEVEWLRDTFTTFGLRPVLFPDIGDSLYGRLADGEYYPHAQGGTPLEEIETLADSAFAVSIGSSMKVSADQFAATAGIPLHHFDHLCTLDEVDRFFLLLEQQSGMETPLKFRRQRRHLQDTLLDTQFYFHGRKAAVAGDPEFLLRWIAPLEDVGVPVSALSSVPAVGCPAGDLRTFGALLTERGAHILIGSSHVAALAEERGLAMVRAGMPVYDRMGEPQSVRTGYEGLAHLYRECANALMERPGERAVPYISHLQQTLR